MNMVDLINIVYAERIIRINPPTFDDIELHQDALGVWAIKTNTGEDSNAKL